MDRRAFVGTLGQAAAAIGAAPLVSDELLAVPQTLTLAAVGDCILTRKVSERTDPRFRELVELLRATDCTWGNCEMTFFDSRKGYPTPKGRDMNLVCEPWGADELAWMGFDCMGNANNHSKDYGEEGLLATIEHLQRAGIGFAGAGPDLQEASRPRYVDTPGGRVAQVNCASSFPSWSMAAYTTPHSNGRPGLNPLRVERTYQLERELFDRLKQVDQGIAEATGREPPEEPPASNELEFMNRQFAPGSPNDVLSEGRAEDLDRIIESIRIARRNARVVIATIHAHESYRERTVPDRFLQPFARACIDAGADAFFGTGPHLLRGVEIYKGKPIFYSIGNFFFQYETVSQIPGEVFRANDLGIRTLDPSVSYDKFDFPEEPYYWESVVPHLTFDGDTLREIELYPIVLGQDEPRHYRGTPVMATREQGEGILNGLAELSEPYGTSIGLRDDGVGFIEPLST